MIEKFSKIKEDIISKLLSKHPVTDEREKAKIDLAAEILAYQKTVIPYPYAKYFITDFTGKYQGQDIIPNHIAIQAKQKLLDYCWKDVKLKQLISIDTDVISFLDQHSSIGYRKKFGHNVVICADRSLSGGPSGKTLCAAIIIKEAIRKRIDEELSCDTYKWIGYSELKKILTDDDLAVSEYSTADWLVVDDIDIDVSSRKAQAYRTSFLDPFFSERINNKIPTILVFRFDIEKIKLSEEDYGVAIYRMVNDKNTTRICLSQ